MIDPNVAGYLMVICAALILVSLDRCVDEYDHWAANRPTKPGTDLVLFLPPELIEERDALTGSITVVTYDTPLPVPPDNEAELAEVQAS